MCANIVSIHWQRLKWNTWSFCFFSHWTYQPVSQPAYIFIIISSKFPLPILFHLARSFVRVDSMATVSVLLQAAYFIEIFLMSKEIIVSCFPVFMSSYSACMQQLLHSQFHHKLDFLWHSHSFSMKHNILWCALTLNAMNQQACVE